MNSKSPHIITSSEALEIRKIIELLDERPEFVKITIERRGENLRGRFNLSDQGQNYILEYAKGLLEKEGTPPVPQREANEWEKVKQLLRERPDFVTTTIEKDGHNLEGRFGVSEEGRKKMVAYARELAGGEKKNTLAEKPGNRIPKASDNKVSSTCPSCFQTVKVPSDRGTLRVTCPKCQFKWTWFPNKSLQFDSLTLRELCQPLFPVVRTDFGKAVPEDPHYETAGIRLNNDINNRYKEYLTQIYDLIEHHPTLYAPYYWLAEHYAEKDKFRDAIEILNKGLSEAKIKSFLAFIMGEVYLQQSNPIAVGWYMQACLLGTEAVLPYLLTAVAARGVGNTKLFWRLRNAKDVLDTGMKELPSAENKVGVLVTNMNKNDLSMALNTFEQYMDSYLPMENDIPKSFDARSIFLGSEMWKYVEEARLKLLRIPSTK